MSDQSDRGSASQAEGGSHPLPRREHPGSGHKKAEPVSDSAFKLALRAYLFVKVAVATFGDIAAGAQPAARGAIGNTEETILRQRRLLIRDTITLLHFNSLHKTNIENSAQLQDFFRSPSPPQKKHFPLSLFNYTAIPQQIQIEKAFFLLFFRLSAQKSRIAVSTEPFFRTRIRRFADAFHSSKSESQGSGMSPPPL